MPSRCSSPMIYLVKGPSPLKPLPFQSLQHPRHCFHELSSERGTRYRRRRATMAWGQWVLMFQNLSENHQHPCSSDCSESFITLDGLTMDHGDHGFKRGMQIHAFYIPKHVGSSKDPAVLKWLDPTSQLEISQLQPTSTNTNLSFKRCNLTMQQSEPAMRNDI